MRWITGLAAFVACIVVHVVLIWPLALLERAIDKRRSIERKQRYYL